MVIRSEAGIYQVLEDHLRKTDKPLTCVDLFDKNDVRKHAADANKVSDFLGHMWRRGLLQRYYSNNTRAKARYAYTWRDVEPQDMTPVMVEKMAQIENRMEERPNVTITEEDGRVILDFPQFTITVQSKARATPLRKKA